MHKFDKPAIGQPQKPFWESLARGNLHPLRATGLEVLQINVGNLCNQHCKHCHVGAGPDRTEVMSPGIMQACIDVLAENQIPTVDITGGAPEMNPNFRWLVEEVYELDRKIIDRSNLTILLCPGYDDLPNFLAKHGVEIVASLPCYLEDNVDAQRGPDVFRRSIEAVRRLNTLGYGIEGSGLELVLVYNPQGPTLPPTQEALENAYRHELQSRYGVVFNRLFTVTNNPINRFGDELIRDAAYDKYMDMLVAAFNPAAAEKVMCRNMISVDWRGRLYDCDFNQALQLGLQPGLPTNIRDFDFQTLSRRRITSAQHCYACTAGAGSSCQGAVLT